MLLMLRQPPPRVRWLSKAEGWTRGRGVACHARWSAL